ncbi:alpha/beta-hydrolase [Paxillus ammoniavirescens]|nr:alpha/beta-hydrolase [Paxillus ammoniavirescens]
MYQSQSDTQGPSKVPYGKWESPITAESIVSGSIAFDSVFVDPITSRVYHVEKRSEEMGRYVIVDTATNKDVIPSPYNARTGVQEYGGAAAIAYDGTVYFSNYRDNRVYSVSEGSSPEPITPDNQAYRYGDFAVHPIKKHLLVSILEDHTIDTPQTVITTLCIINTQLKAVFPLVVGADFYATPVFNPSGTKIAWQEWYHPDMPWEGSLLYVADILVQSDTLLVTNKLHVAGKKLDVSIGYPTWVDNSTLLYTSDASEGFQNPFIYSTATGQATLAFDKPVHEDFCRPAWSLGTYPHAILEGGNCAAFVAFRDGRHVLYVVDLTKSSAAPVEVTDFPFVLAAPLRAVGSRSFAFIGLKSDGPGGVILCTLSGTSFVPGYQVLKSSSSSLENEEYISPPVSKTLIRDGEPLHVVYYAPKNPRYAGSSVADEKPPCLVTVHGGPTSLMSQDLSWTRVYFTSRGYACLDVNHGGSAGYGRKYIERLKGNWGIVDVKDCIDAFSMLASDPYSLIDGNRVAIRGGSAGGFTTLAALSIAPDTKSFKAACSYYGVSDLLTFVQTTHKYELRYIEKLLGGTADQIPDVYKARSAVYHAENISVPLLVLQGSIDKIVLPSQAEEVVAKIRQQPGGEDRVEYHLFEGEGHGWKLASTIVEALKLEHAWYDKKLL